MHRIRASQPVTLDQIGRGLENLLCQLNHLEYGPVAQNALFFPV